MQKWLILSDVVKYVHYNQYLIGHYALQVKASEERHSTKMYKILKDGEKRYQEISFNSNTKSLKHDYPDIFEGDK